MQHLGAAMVGGPDHDDCVADDIRDRGRGSLRDRSCVDRHDVEHAVEEGARVEWIADRVGRLRHFVEIGQSLDRRPLSLEARECGVADVVARADLDRDQLPAADPSICRLVMHAQTPCRRLEIHALTISVTREWRPRCPGRHAASLPTRIPEPMASHRTGSSPRARLLKLSAKVTFPDRGRGRCARI